MTMDSTMARMRFLLSSRMGGSATLAVGGRRGLGGPGALRLGDYPQRAPKIVDQEPIVCRQDVAPADHDHIRLRIKIIGRSQSDCVTQATLDPVSLSGMADLLGDRKADAQAQPVV